MTRQDQELNPEGVHAVAKKNMKSAVHGACNTALQVHIPEDWNVALEGLSDLHGVSKGEIVRGCLEYFLNGALPYLETRQQMESKRPKRVLSKPWAAGGFRRS